MLNREQVTEQIKAWMAAVQAANAQLILLGDMTGALDYDAPLPRAIEALIEGYGAAVSRMVGDEGGWLEYFRIDCAFGDNPMAVIPESGAAEIKIDGPESLARVICWDRERGEAAR
jgi:hypothetical protein